MMLGWLWFVTLLLSIVLPLLRIFLPLLLLGNRWVRWRRQERLEWWEMHRGRCHGARGLLRHLGNQAVCFAEAGFDGEVDC